MKHDLNSLQKFQDEIGEKVREVRTGTSDQVAKKVTKEVWKAWLLTNPAELVGRQIEEQVEKECRTNGKFAC